MSKYYFITYQATNRQGTTSCWNQVINVSPMFFIQHLAKVEEAGSQTYYNFVVINTCEISAEEYERFKDQF